MNSFDTAIESLSLSLFDAIPSQTVPEDRDSLLRIQRRLREQGDYVYLEIGSHLGGTIQPHYADPRCRRIHSVDKRPLSQPDERGTTYDYPENSTQAMRDLLSGAYPSAPAEKLRTFDADSGEVDPEAILEPPDLCLVDGEHTDEAVVRDLRFCLAVCKPDALLCAHDAGVVGEGLQRMQRELTECGVVWTGLKLGGSLYAFALGASGAMWRSVLAPVLEDERTYFRGAAFYRRRQRREARLRHRPSLLRMLRLLTRGKDWLYLRTVGRLTGAARVDGDHPSAR